MPFASSSSSSRARLLLQGRLHPRQLQHQLLLPLQLQLVAHRPFHLLLLRHPTLAVGGWMMQRVHGGGRTALLLRLCQSLRRQPQRLHHPLHLSLSTRWKRTLRMR